MRLKWRFLWLAIPTALALVGAGCAGVNSSQSVSPLDFFLPGAGHFMKTDLSPTNALVSFPENPAEVALIK